MRCVTGSTEVSAEVDNWEEVVLLSLTVVHNGVRLVGQPARFRGKSETRTRNKIRDTPPWI